MRIDRWRYSGGKVEMTEHSPKKKILIIVVNPKNTKRLNVDKEANEIQKVFRRSERFEIVQSRATTLQEIRRALLANNIYIVHFCGHGTENGIMVEDNSGSGATLYGSNSNYSKNKYK